ncbi:MAG: Holliday junction resolvase RuvX [Pseudomonadales bacterium]|nr:Holliday junction resolvase RuvX [Pseudomonadales bacterium]
MNQSMIMGFDYGTHRIGVAIGQRITQTASPLAILKARQGQPNWSEIEALIIEWQPEAFVVGLPLHMDDEPSDLSVQAEKFARRLTGRFNLPHTMVDERLSSVEAKNLSAGDAIDDVAAVLILETYLSSESTLT